VGVDCQKNGLKRKKRNPCFFPVEAPNKKFSTFFIITAKVCTLATLCRNFIFKMFVLSFMVFRMDANGFSPNRT